MADLNVSEIFENERARLFGLAYRMLGSVADAEDMVQDTWLRWSKVDVTTINNPQAFLTTIITRLSLDQLKSAKHKKETYVGSWLPEPLLSDAQSSPSSTPDQAVEIADDVSFALILAMEKLSPAERASFLLHDVFDLDFDEIGKTLDRTPASCRKLASRARQKVRTDRDQTLPMRPEEPLITSFHAALQTGDLESFIKFIAEDAVLVTDGGGIKTATLNPIYGRIKILKFFAGLLLKYGRPSSNDIKLTTINNSPGILVREADGSLQAWSMSWTPEGQISELYIIRNPEKLGHVVFD